MTFFFIFLLDTESEVPNLPTILLPERTTSQATFSNVSTYNTNVEKEKGLVENLFSILW